MQPDARAIPIDDDHQPYALLQMLSPERTFLCQDSSGNIVVLKRLDDDCLPGMKLHPHIRSRLERVQELAHPHVATLRTVERWNHFACMVWVHLDGEPLDSVATVTPAMLAALVAAVDALHQLGIVHGNIHGRNVIVRPNQQVWLTDISPYLYTDPMADIAALMDLLTELATRLPADQASAVILLLSQSCDLRDLTRALAGIGVDPPKQSNAPERLNQASRKWRSLLAALVVAGLGVASWFVIRSDLSKVTRSSPATFPSLRSDVRP